MPHRQKRERKTYCVLADFLLANEGEKVSAVFRRGQYPCKNCSCCDYLSFIGHSCRWFLIDQKYLSGGRRSHMFMTYVSFAPQSRSLLTLSVQSSVVKKKNLRKCFLSFCFFAVCITVNLCNSGKRHHMYPSRPCVARVPSRYTRHIFSDLRTIAPTYG